MYLTHISNLLAILKHVFSDSIDNIIPFSAFQVFLGVPQG